MTSECGRKYGDFAEASARIRGMPSLDLTHLLQPEAENDLSMQRCQC